MAPLERNGDACALCYALRPKCGRRRSSSTRKEVADRYQNTSNSTSHKEFLKRKAIITKTSRKKRCITMRDVSATVAGDRPGHIFGYRCQSADRAARGRDVTQHGGRRVKRR